MRSILLDFPLKLSKIILSLHKLRFLIRKGRVQRGSSIRNIHREIQIINIKHPSRYVEKWNRKEHETTSLLSDLIQITGLTKEKRIRTLSRL